MRPWRTTLVVLVVSLWIVLELELIKISCSALFRSILHYWIIARRRSRRIEGQKRHKLWAGRSTRI